MKIWFNPSFNDQKAKRRVSATIRKVFAQADELLNFKKEVSFYVDFVGDEGRRKNNKYLIGAEAFGSGVVFLWFRRWDYDRAELIDIICHELNHCKRSEVEHIDGGGLFQTIITEGLAESFEREFGARFNYEFPNHVKMSDLSEELFVKYLGRAIKIDDEGTEWIHDEWVYIFEKKFPTPKNLVYKLGKILLQKYILAENKTASELVYVPTKKFRKFAEKILEEYA